MLLGFVHFDRSDQKKYLAVLSRITEGGAIDELGVGRLRDYYSDLMFPGISSLHQHAKYFSLMPLLYKEAASVHYKSLSEVRPTIRQMEIKMTRRLVKGSPDAHGITGSDTLDGGGTSYVKYDPMYIYGMALQTYGIVLTENIEAAIFEASRKNREKPVKLSSNDQEQGDSDDNDFFLNYCRIPNDIGYDWKEECSLDLTYNEAVFIRNKILDAPRCQNTLLHHLLEKEEEIKEDTFEDFLETHKDLPEKLLSDTFRAARFSDLVDGLYLRYNWLYSNKTDTDKLAEFDQWYKTIFIPRQESMLHSITGVVINDNRSIPFCTKAIELLSDGKYDELNQWIIDRERFIKMSRSKIGNNEKYHYDKSKPIHAYKLQYRWPTVVTLVNEILKPLRNG